MLGTKIFISKTVVLFQTRQKFVDNHTPILVKHTHIHTPSDNTYTDYHTCDVHRGKLYSVYHSQPSVINIIGLVDDRGAHTLQIHNHVDQMS